MPEEVHRPSGETLRFMQEMWNLSHALDVRSKRMAVKLGVTGPQRLVIRVIGQKPEMTASEIAATLGLHPSTLSGVLSRLDKGGFIERRVDAEDRRRARFTLTASGKKIDAHRKGTVEAAVRRALGRAEPDMRGKMVGLIDLLVEELAKED